MQEMEEDATLTQLAEATVNLQMVRGPVWRGLQIIDSLSGKIRNLKLEIGKLQKEDEYTVS